MRNRSESCCFQAFTMYRLMLLLAFFASGSYCGSLSLSKSVSWTSLKKDRVAWDFCDKDFSWLMLHKTWDMCANVSLEKYGGNYKDQIIASPNEILKKNYADFLQRNCFCDEECGRYGDCCLDAAEMASYDGTDDDKDSWKCVSLPGRYPSTIDAVYAKSSCKEGFLESGFNDAANTVSRCLMDGRDNKKFDYVQFIPVLSKNTNAFYRNIYCAICNEDYELKKWNINITCEQKISSDELRDGDYLSDRYFYPKYQHWHFKHKGSENKCGISINDLVEEADFTRKHGLRACKYAIDTCLPDWPNPKDFARCKMFASYLYIQWPMSRSNVTVYKNYHCALCNNVNPDDLLCFDSEAMWRGTPHQSMSILFDFNLRTGDVVGKTDDGCSSGELYDPLRKKCMAFHCGRLYKSVDGKCVPNEDATFQNNSLILDCQTVSLNRNEFALLKDNSVFVNATEKIYKRGHYEIENPRNESYMTLTICKEGHYSQLFKFTSTQAILSEVCMYISIICLVFHIVSYTAAPKLRNLPGKNLLSLSCSLFVGQMLFLFGIHQTEIQLLCSAMAVAMHFFFLAYFFWMSVMAIDICRTFSSDVYRPSSGSKTFFKYSCFAWWTPTVLVTSAIAVDNVDSIDSSFRPGYGKGLCWITQRKSLMLFFALPVALTMIVNIVMFSVSTWNIKKSEKISRTATKRSDKIRLILYIKLALIMGISWILAFIAAFVDNDAVWYPFIILNGLQGAFIFFAFSFKRKVFTLVIESISKSTSSTAQESTSSTGKRSMVMTNIKHTSFINANKKQHSTSDTEVRIKSKSNNKDSTVETKIKKQPSNHLKVPFESDA